MKRESSSNQKTNVIELNYSPMQKQRIFHLSRARFKGLIGGVGSGKTIAGVIEAIQTAVENPKSVGMIVAPSYRMLRDTTERTFFELCPRELVREHVRGEKRVIFWNGSEIWFRSADEPETLRGPNLSWFWIDEASLVGEMAWKILIARLRKPPELAWITTTPKGFTWIFREFAEKKRENYFLIHVSSYENKFLSKEFLQSLTESYSGVFAKQEIEGMFVGAEGLVYDNFSRFVHVKEF